MLQAPYKKQIRKNGDLNQLYLKLPVTDNVPRLFREILADIHRNLLSKNLNCLMREFLQSLKPLSIHERDFKQMYSFAIKTRSASV